MKIDRRDFLVATSSALLASTVVSGSPSVSLPEGGVETPQHVPPGKISVYTTAKDTDQRLAKAGDVESKPMGQPLETQTCVFIDPRRTFQTFLGIGGAITDSSAETLAKIPAAKQQELIHAYFDPNKGIGYTLARTNIHSCDFSSGSYTYVDGTVGWTDWNVLLDEKGGPNHVQNFCFAPAHADTRTGELTYTKSYYYIGHFSKFIKPGAKRIATSASRSSLISTAFVNPDGKVAAIVMNRGHKSVDYHLWLSGDGAEVTSPAHSIQTFVF